MVPDVQYKKQCYMVQYKKAVVVDPDPVGSGTLWPRRIRVQDDCAVSRYEFSDEKIGIVEVEEYICVEVFYFGASKTCNQSLWVVEIHQSF